MSWNLKRRSAVMAGLAAATCAAIALPAAASAADGSGKATILVATNGKGQTLSGQGVKLVAGAGAARKGGKLALPISTLDPSDKRPSAETRASLRFKRGKLAVALSGIRFDLASRTLKGTLGGKRMGVFKLGAGAEVDATAGSLSLAKGKLRLTPAAAKALKEKLGLTSGLALRGVGTIWLAAQASPMHSTAQPVVSGLASWGVLTSWRAYVLGNFGPGSVGTITTGDGAGSKGTLSAEGATFELPAATGSFEKGLYGAADLLTLKTAGSVTFAKPGHCIIEIKFSGIELKLNGADSSIVLDAISDVDTPAGMTCVDVPALTTNDVHFAKLDLTGITPTHSADGKSVTWSAIPATLTAAGGTAWNAGYGDGQVLDPLTITIGLG